MSARYLKNELTCRQILCQPRRSVFRDIPFPPQYRDDLLEGFVVQTNHRRPEPSCSIPIVRVPNVCKPALEDGMSASAELTAAVYHFQ
ncbi:hypothetical protein J6590_090148 [Homalodisca vitripennis]|nr:hypothetical protein J6590_090148 [Homalodisca vitripennis]